MKIYVKSMHNKGYTLLEVLVAMFCMSVAMLLLIAAVSIMSRRDVLQYINEDHIAVAQLRVLMAQSEWIEVQGDMLQFRYHGEDSRLEVDRSRLVRRSGYVIYLKDIDEAHFDWKGDELYVSWRRGERKKRALLLCR